jgi:hypothetical protein
LEWGIGQGQVERKYNGRLKRLVGRRQAESLEVEGRELKMGMIATNAGTS